MGRSERTTRAKARMVGCPRCGAVAGQMCRGAKGKPRASGHAERHRAYLELAALGRENERLHEMQARNRDRAASR